MQTNQANLEDFDCQTAGTTPTTPTPDASLNDKTLCDELPAPRGRFNQAQFERLGGAVVAPAKANYSPDAGQDTLLFNTEHGYVVADAHMVTDSPEAERLPIPDTYAAIREYGPHHFAVDGGTVLSVTGERLEASVRLATGGGNFRAADLAVYVVPPCPCFFVSYRGEMFAVRGGSEGATVDPREAPDLCTVTEVSGHPVVESSESIRNALPRVLELIEAQTEYEVTGFSAAQSGSHYIETADPDTPTINVRTRRLPAVTGPQTPEDAAGTYDSSDEPVLGNYEVSVSADDFWAEAGETASRVETEKDTPEGVTADPYPAVAYDCSFAETRTGFKRQVSAKAEIVYLRWKKSNDELKLSVSDTANTVERF